MGEGSPVGVATSVHGVLKMYGESLSFAWGGVERTFDYWLPKGWIRFIEEFQAINAVRGLPVLIMLHGGSDSAAPNGPTSMSPGDYEPTDPAKAMLEAWRFHRFADRRYDQVTPNDDTTDPVDIEDRFAVIVPHALKTNHGKGGWNTGYQDRIEYEVDDIGFIRECVTRLAARMTARLTALSRPIPADGVLDTRRHFIFGYSNGGMMAYRLLTDSFFADRVGAICVVAGSIGGRGHDSVPVGGPTVTNSPVLNPAWPTIPSTISLLAIHGEQDSAVVSGPPGAIPGVIAPSDSSRNYFISGGLLSPQADEFRRVDRNLAMAENVFAAFLPNGCTASHTVTSLPSVMVPGTTEGRIRRRPTAPAPFAINIPFKGAPGVSYPWFVTVNPEVWVLWDKPANHATITGAGADNRWPDVAFIWAWFRRHRKANA